MVDIGQPGSNSDGGIWEGCTFGKSLKHGNYIIYTNNRILMSLDSLCIPHILGHINLPDPEVLPRTQHNPTPYHFVADEAFPLDSSMMRPYPGRTLERDEMRIFNYRLSRARRVIENTFG